ncbi:hypothetical protein [Muricomes intestini]|jgi:hypothetical protein|uniref:Uncharacterized protein n=1 Tax=Muricomes intestini TaxID=1796634 RepID=A0A4R3KB89_9FIRM|nr:hypothetical protein [Muricomes intestini]TCS80243.1 hypothetical protein EDD59_10669 [Muricomes intestini]HAX52982.1 hypothetical protein [Lachnospiraceae bacterium]HCR81939.1 hypothetical protein [Lachnospiraceae bacterium]
MLSNKKNQKIIDDYDYLSNAASSMDCTGLIPSAPLSDAELESYNDLYQYQTPAAKGKKSKHADSVE